MSKKKQKNSNLKRKIIIWAVSITAALVLFGIFLTVEGYLSYKAQRDNTIKKTVDSIINTNSTGDEDPGKISQFELSIPKIGVSVPVIPNVDGGKKSSYDTALTSGVAHFVGTALPNSGSNIFIFGHSSSIMGTGKYDKVFAKLNNLVVGDEITILYNGNTYKYTVSSKNIIQPQDTSVLEPTMKEQLTLMTCWPIGTDQKRLVVIAKPVK